MYKEGKKYQIVRGGSWLNGGDSSKIELVHSQSGSNYIGFRIVCTFMKRY